MGFAVSSSLEDEIPVNFKTSCWLEFPHMAQKIWTSKEPIIVYPTLTGTMYILFWQFVLQKYSL